MARRWYVWDAKWKLNQAGELFDIAHAPFEELLVAADTRDAAALAAHHRLQGVLNKLDPAGGILDDRESTGRHNGREEKEGPGLVSLAGAALPLLWPLRN